MLSVVYISNMIQSILWIWRNRHSPCATGSAGIGDFPVLFSGFFIEGVPSLCLEGEFLSVAGDEGTAQIGAGDVPDDAHIVQGSHLFVQRKGNGEEQFVVLAAVEGASADVHVEFFGSDGCLVVERQPFLVDAAACARCGADVEQFGRKSVADVHHGRGADAGFAQGMYDVAPCFGFEQPFEQVFASAEVGLCRFGVVCRAGIEHRLFALHELEAHVGGAEVAADADEVGVLGSVAVDDVFIACFADAGDADGQSGERGRCVAADQVDSVLVAGQAQSRVEVLEVFDGEAAAHGDAHHDLPGSAVHGIDIGKVDHGGFVAQMLDGRILQVEMDAFHQQVGGDQLADAGGRCQYGAVVAHA